MRLRTALVLSFFSQLTACGSFMDFDFGPGCFICADFGPFLDVPYEAQILRGDTIRIRALGSTDNQGYWRLVNDVAAFENAAGKHESATGPVDNVLLRALRLGQAFITFLPVTDTSMRITSNLVVRDSAEVADIEFQVSAVSDTLRLKVGEPVWLTVLLVDDQRHAIHAAPESFTISDTLVLRRQSFALPPVPGDSGYQGAKAGTAEVVATFRELRRTLVVIVHD